MDIGLPFMLDLTPNTLCAMLVVVAMLILASITQLLLRSRLSEDGYLELKQRINSWWVMVGVVFTALMIGPTASLIFFTILSFIALREFFSILPVRVTDRRLILALYLAVPLQYYWVGMGWYGMFIVFIPVYLFLFVLYYSISAAAGVVYRGPIISVVMVFVFWFLCFVVGTAKDLIEGLEVRPSTVYSIIATDEGLLAINMMGHVHAWSESRAAWEPVFSETEQQRQNMPGFARVAMRMQAGFPARHA